MEVDCPKCGNAGVISVQRMEQYRDSDGKVKSRSVTVDETCSRCKGRGKIEGPGVR